MTPTPLLSVKNLRVSFRTDKKHSVEAVKGMVGFIVGDQCIHVDTLGVE